MNNLLVYLLELNISLVILFVAYKIFFERDKNFVIRRIYLLGVVILPFILLFIPETAQLSLSRIPAISLSMGEITVFGTGPAQEVSGGIALGKMILVIYLFFLCLGIMKLFIQLIGIVRTIIKSDRFESKGTAYLSNTSLHASSFFGYIFMDHALFKENSFHHILEHENIHKREFHSVDRILVELFVLINWFNPVAWMLRKSVIQNLEYLADYAVLKNGIDPTQYQLSILNQYIGSASISNQFSNQIKNRINMLNKDYKLGTSWKLALIFPLVFIAFLIVSCTEKDATMLVDGSLKKTALTENAIFTEVEEMPSFQGREVNEFRKFIAKNLVYPEEAKENGASGKVFVKFVVRKNGKVEIPDIKELPPTLDGTEIGEVVVVGYRPLDPNAPAIDEKFIELLKKEAIRVVTSSPNWEPGKVDGEPVDVMFTFPINFVLQ